MKFVQHSKGADENSIWFYFLKEEKGSYAKCKKCANFIKTGGGSTSGLHTHLKTKHEINLRKRAAAEPVAGSSSQCDKLIVNSLTKITKYFRNTKDDSLAAVLARMTARDGLPFRVFITSDDLRKSLKALNLSDELPKSANTIKKIVTDYSEKIRQLLINEISDRKLNGKGFSITFDEWTSLRNRRYININLHSENCFWNLGLLRINGSLPAKKCVELLSDKLNHYGLSLEKNIICLINDGAAVMQKVGKLVPAAQQLCLAHAIQLAVVDVLYKKSSTEDTNNNPNESIYMDSDSETEDINNYDSSEGDEYDYEAGLVMEYKIQGRDIDLTHNQLCPLIQEVRKIVKIFKRSPTRNQVLQDYVRVEFGKEYCLILDSKTRWNSLIVMLERFFKLKSSIKKSAIVLNLNINLTNADFETISLTVSTLLPVKLAVESLCREDANLLSADTTFKFMFDSLSAINSSLSKEVRSALMKRILERRTELSDLIGYLHKGLVVNSQITATNKNLNQTFNFPPISKSTILKLLLGIVNQMGLWNQNTAVEERSNEILDLEVSEAEEDLIEISDKSESSLQKKLDEAILKQKSYTATGKKPERAGDLTKCLKKEISLFEDEGVRGKYIQQIYNLLLTIRPTSIESERAFSAAGLILNKFRCRLDDKTLDALCFLRGHFKGSKSV